jgi:hypothetical protein
MSRPSAATPDSSTPASAFAPRALGRPARAPDNGALLRLRTLMGAEGLPCDLVRLCGDKLYAYECIATANARGSEALRRLALELFQIFQRRDAARPAGAPTN